MGRTTTTRGDTPLKNRGGRKPGKWKLVAPEEIRTFRDASGLSRARLAKQLGVSTTSVQNWESGKVASDKIQQRLRALIDGEPVDVPAAANGQEHDDDDDGAVIDTTGAIVAAYLATQRDLKPDQLPELVRRVRRALLT